jgi:hypothetical protein
VALSAPLSLAKEGRHAAIVISADLEHLLEAYDLDVLGFRTLSLLQATV